VTVHTGTLCRLIPLDRNAGRVVKYRVEHGDVGGVLGVVMFDLLPPNSEYAGRPWKAWYVEDEEKPYDEPRLLDRFHTPEAAALRLAAERFVLSEEMVKKTELTSVGD
jgi:hypothetical protein